MADPTARFIARLLLLATLLLGSTRIAAGGEDWGDRSLPTDVEPEGSPVPLVSLSYDAFGRREAWVGAMSSDDGHVLILDDGEAARASGTLAIRVDFQRRSNSVAYVRLADPILVPGSCESISVEAFGGPNLDELVAVVADYYGRTFELAMGKIPNGAWAGMKAALIGAGAGQYGRIVQDDTHLLRPQGLLLLGFGVRFLAQDIEGSYEARFRNLAAETRRRPERAVP
jgi:hypothetical protein